jgi:pimeloyl-ACP methyl ester carboxylesterase
MGESEMPEGWIASPEREARQLRKLLTLLDAPPPYVLVGHSWGGALIVIYSGLFQSDVAGMVYIDPIPDAAATSEDIFGTSDPARVAEIREWEAARQREMWPSLSPGLRAAATAMNEFMDTPVEARGIPDDLPVPTAFLLQVDVANFEVPPIFGDGFAKGYIDRNIECFSARVRANPHATLTLVGRSGHDIHRDRPEVVTSALEWVLIGRANPN